MGLATDPRANERAIPPADPTLAQVAEMKREMSRLAGVELTILERLEQVHEQNAAILRRLGPEDEEPFAG